MPDLSPSDRTPVSGPLASELQSTLDGAASPQSVATIAASHPHAAPVILPAECYVVGGEIARGGMGAILQAHDQKLGRVVAMKVMKLHATASESARARFVREATVLARLEHPNVVPIHELGWDAEKRLYYTMKLVQGRTLQAVLDGLRHNDPEFIRQYTLDRLLTIFRKICDAMSMAHAKGVIHRDLKPDNIMVGEFGEVLVMDWGLAKIAADPEQAAEEAAIKAEATRSGSARRFLDAAGAALRLPGNMTMDGDVIGTPQFMSPEQAMGHAADVDQHSDLYSLGAILYAVLTLHPPVKGESATQIMSLVAQGRIEPPTVYNPGSKAGANATSPRSTGAHQNHYEPLPHCPGHKVPAGLSAVTMRALATEKSRRYGTVAELAADVEAWQHGFATRAQEAGLLTQIRLLIQRHRREVSIAFAAWLVITALAIWFVLNLRASERETRHQAVIAHANEQRAIAQEHQTRLQAAIASANEQRAISQEDQTRRMLGKAQVAVAEAAFRSGDRSAMVAALDSVPDDLRSQQWEYLSAKRDESLGELKWTGSPVSAVAAVPGKPTQFAVADAKGNVAVVDVRTNQRIISVKTGFSGFIALAFSADGSRFAATNRGAPEIRIYRASDGALQQTLTAPTRALRRLSFSPDAKLLAASDAPALASAGNTLSLLDLHDGSIRWQLGPGYTDVVFSRDGTRLFLIGWQGHRKFKIVDAATGKILVNRDAYVYSMAMNQGGELLALGMHNGEVAILNAQSGAELRRARLHQGEVTQVAWTAAGHLLTLGSEGGSETASRGRCMLRLTESISFMPRGTFFGIAQGRAAPPAWDFQPGSGYLLTGETKPQLWRLAIDVEAGRIVSNAEQGWSLAFLNDAVLFTRKSYQLAPYDIANPAAPRELPGATEGSEVMCAVNWRAKLLATAIRINMGSVPIKLYAFDGATLALKRRIPISGWTHRMDFDASGDRLLALNGSAPSGRKTIEVFSTENGQSLLKLPLTVERAVFAGAAGNIIAIEPRQSSNGAPADEVVIFDARSGQLLRKAAFSSRLNELVASSDRRLIATAGEEPFVHILDADTLEVRHNFRAHDDSITAMAFHPTQAILATASNDGSLKLWDYASAHLRQRFLGIDGAPVMLAFSPLGNMLALESQEHKVRIFDLATDATKATGTQTGN